MRLRDHPRQLLLVQRGAGRLRSRGDVLRGGQGFVVLHSTTKDGSISKIVSQLGPGDVVTTLKNTVDKVVTEWGVAELRGRSIRERTRGLIAIAHPDHRYRLRAEAATLGYC